MLTFLLNRLAERSTWLGLTAFASAAGVQIQPELAGAITSTGLGVAGIISMITKG
jgi:hypothetical protein